MYKDQNHTRCGKFATNAGARRHLQDAAQAHVEKRERHQRAAEPPIAAEMVQHLRLKLHDAADGAFQ